MIHKNYSTPDVQSILLILAQTYPEATCELNYHTPFQLLIATILSAQTTDKKVNIVTSTLFADYPAPADFVTLSPEELEEKIKMIGLYHMKAKNILATCRILLSEYQGKVPQTMEELLKLPGVGRKTANVVLANAFSIPAFAVDTHVFRVSNRIGLAHSDNILEVEEQLKSNIPREQWIIAHHWLIWHGRRICLARNPRCNQCPLQDHCQFFHSDNLPQISLNKKTR